MNSFLVQSLVLLFLFWFLFLREDFNELPRDEEMCERCNKTIFNGDMKITTFKNKCIALDGQYIKENEIRYCKNHKSKLDLNHRCNCEIN
jgi:hypothetical protein